MIELNAEEQRICRFIAKLRDENNRKNGVEDKRRADKDRDLDLEGFGAEMAFCKMMNLYPDFDIGVRSGSVDAFTKKGFGTDVKAIPYKYKYNPLLIAPNHKEGKTETEIYALMVGDFPKYQCVGWALGSELINDDNLKDLGHGKDFVMEKDKLKPIKDLEKLN